MDQGQQELDRESIEYLTRKAKAKEEAHSKACWIDGSECLYGQPEGQFLLRPRQFCRPTREQEEVGCGKIDDNSDDLNEIARKLQRREIEITLSAIMGEQVLSLSGEVDVAAESEKDEKKKGVLKLAIAIIEEREKAKDPFIVKIFR